MTNTFPHRGIIKKGIWFFLFVLLLIILSVVFVGFGAKAQSCPYPPLPPQEVPPPPSNIRVLNKSDTSITWTWDAPDPGCPPAYKIDRYEVYVVTAAFNVRGPHSVVSNSFTDTYSQNLINGGKSTIQVRTCNTENVCGQYSAQYTAYTYLYTPTNVKHTSQGFNTITWQWDVNGNATYYIFKDVLSGNSINLSKSTYCGGATCTFLETDELGFLNKNTAYSRSVQACNANTCSLVANVSAYTSIEAPSGVLFGSVTETSIQAKANGTFSNLTSGASKIQIQNITTGTTLECTHCNNYLTFTGLSPCTTYTFKARACNGDCKNDGTGDYTTWSPQFNQSTLCPSPDLTTSQVGTWNNNVCKGTQQYFRYKVNNVGSGNAGYFYNRLYVNGMYTGQQEFVPTTIYSGLSWPSSNGSSCLNSDGTFCWTPQSTGSHLVSIKSDSGNSSNILDCGSGSGGSVSESDETNNCTSSYKVTVIDVPSAPGTPTFSNIDQTPHALPLRVLPSRCALPAKSFISKNKFSNTAYNFCAEKSRNF